MIGIDLNTVEGDEEEGGPSAEPPRGTVCLELWHACAGPVGPLPRKGSAVVYLPEGHLEYIGEAAGAVAAVPPHVFCRVVDVNLQVRARARGLVLVLYGVRRDHNVFEVLTDRACSLQADPATDEVYAQVSLVVDNEEAKRRMRQGESEEACEGDGEDTDAAKRRARMPHMFCKTLTASDTSTHGGFSVPRRAAEDCFPPLDYNLQRPSQELVAKDLHGTEWRFRHIYRGTATAIHWLIAYSSGSAYLSGFPPEIYRMLRHIMRGEDGVLRLGVRRAAQLKNVSPVPALFNQDSSLSSLGNVAQAVAVKSIFHIYYNPRLCESEFIVPYWKFMRSFSQPFSVGMRFKMKYENEDASERRSTGTITGSRESDPKSHGSKWKCLVLADYSMPSLNFE
uniref:Auxin response factor n=1 Tax=Aegilops tauschii TaxID=37682 RepID=M8CFM4_AEGTA